MRGRLSPLLETDARQLWVDIEVLVYLVGMVMRMLLALAVMITGCCSEVNAKHLCHLDDSKPQSEKIALILMNGFGGSSAGCQAQLAFWKDQGMDVFIPDVLKRQSLEASSAAMHAFVEEFELDAYREVRAICYIAGAYLLHAELAVHPLPNLTHIIYDRSPTQERAPQVAVSEIPLLGWMAMGPVLKDLSEATWPEVPVGPHLIKGLAIENRATRLMRMLEEAARAMGPLDYEWRHIDSTAVDAFHVPLDHDMMYVRWDVLGAAFQHFFDHAQFPEDAAREPLFENPFDRTNPIPQ